ncbi:hypothetical protein X798_03092 [Onchocerca flexuosa]|uniref:Uncharacterized protein n=1 Tax=Onchocerca flexuosa TaxID=387005 RepID=A0A238BYH2_9BILA|nr:hypothetical protein X798_03092 [Onchocerca flexuosa]
MTKRTEINRMSAGSGCCALFHMEYDYVPIVPAKNFCGTREQHPYFNPSETIRCSAGLSAEEWASLNLADMFLGRKDCSRVNGIIRWAVSISSTSCLGVTNNIVVIMGEPVAKRCKTDNETNGDSSKAVGDYDAATQKILEQIDQVQSEIDSLNEKASEEILKASFRSA